MKNNQKITRVFDLLPNCVLPVNKNDAFANKPGDVYQAQV